MDDENILDLGQGAWLIGGLDPVDLSTLETLIEIQECAGNTGEIEVETTK